MVFIGAIVAIVTIVAIVPIVTIVTIGLIRYSVVVEQLAQPCHLVA